jgi:hypothetical protein
LWGCMGWCGGGSWGIGDKDGGWRIEYTGDG